MHLEEDESRGVCRLQIRGGKMGKTILKAGQASQLLALLARQMGPEMTLAKAILALNGNPKQDVAVIFTDSFGNADIKPV